MFATNVVDKRKGVPCVRPLGGILEVVWLAKYKYRRWTNRGKDSSYLIFCTRSSVENIHLTCTKEKVNTWSILSGDFDERFTFIAFSIAGGWVERVGAFLVLFWPKGGISDQNDRAVRLIWSKTTTNRSVKSFCYRICVVLLCQRIQLYSLNSFLQHL